MAFAPVRLKNILLHLTVILDSIFYPASWQFQFFCLLVVTFLPPPWRFFCLTAIFYSTLQPRLTRIFYLASWLSARLFVWLLCFFILLFACWQCSSPFKPNGLCSCSIKKYSIAPHVDIRCYILSYLTAISFFSLPHGGNFSSASMAFLAASWQYYIRPCSRTSCGYFIWPHGLQHICLYDCHFSSACLPCLGSFVLNGHSLTLNLPHGNLRHIRLYDYLFSSACLPWLGSFVPYGHFLKMNAPHGNALLGLAAMPHGTILFGLAVEPHGKILFSHAHNSWWYFIRPCGRASWRYRFILHLTAMINFFFASRWYRFCLCIAAVLPASPAMSNGSILELCLHYPCWWEREATAY